MYYKHNIVLRIKRDNRSRLCQIYRCQFIQHVHGLLPEFAFLVALVWAKRSTLNSNRTICIQIFPCPILPSGICWPPSGRESEKGARFLHPIANHGELWQELRSPSLCGIYSEDCYEENMGCTVETTDNQAAGSYS